MRRFLHTTVLSSFMAMSLLTANAMANDAGVAAPPTWLSSIDARYQEQLRASGLDKRDFSAEQWWQAVTPLLEKSRAFKVVEIGRSAEDRPLRHVQWGKGKTPILLWSQMHGDEATGSMALADLFRFLSEHPNDPLVRQLREHTTLHFLPVMNPDGAARFQRRNAQGVDLNRDALALSTAEARALKALHDKVKPVFGFNLHDQGVGYRAGDSERGTAIALLSPPYDASRKVNDVRERAIQVSSVIRSALEPYISGYIARWDDEFNPVAFGDLTTQWGTSTVLIEAGGIEGDTEKQQLRKLYFFSLVAALDSIASGNYRNYGQQAYFDLPENGKVWPDLTIRGATVVNTGLPPLRADVQVNFRNPLRETGGNVSAFGDLRHAPSRHSIDASGLYLIPIADKEKAALSQGSAARFHLSRDPQGREIIWTLDRDVNPAKPRP